jgi:hypothetical protein
MSYLHTKSALQILLTKGIKCPGLDEGAGIVLRQGQQDRHAGVEVLAGAQAPHIPSKFSSLRTEPGRFNIYIYIKITVFC